MLQNSLLAHFDKNAIKTYSGGSGSESCNDDALKAINHGGMASPPNFLEVPLSLSHFLTLSLSSLSLIVQQTDIH